MEWIKKNSTAILGLLLVAAVIYTGYVTDWKFTKTVVV